MTITSAPTHPGLLHVHRVPGDYASSLTVLRSFGNGQVICPIEGTRTAHKAYTSVQVRAEPAKPLAGVSAHIELQSDLVYANHSCNPSVAFEVPADPSQWQVRSLRKLMPGDAITFFYPSTEWDMAQPFECDCGSSRCLGRITGARDLPAHVLERYYLNDHIRQLKDRQGAAH